MATILTKKKDTTGAPSAGDLTNSSGGAELAVNTADKRLYTKDSGGNVVEVGINPTSITTGTLNTSGAVVFNDAGADVDFRVEGDTNANLLFVDAGNDRVGIGTSSPTATLTVDGNAVFNESGGNFNFRVEGDTDPNLFFCDAGTDRVGIGTSSPAQLVEASKSQAGDTAIQVTNVNTGTGTAAQFFASNGTTKTQFFHLGTNYTTAGPLIADSGGVYTSSSAGLSFVAGDASGVIRFGSGGITERMVIDSSGHVGIGVTPADSFSFNRALDIGSTTGGFYYCRDTDATNGVGGIGYSGTDLYIANKAVGNIRFFCNTDASERMRIDSSGNLLVGTTTSPDANSILRFVKGTADVRWYDNTDGGIWTTFDDAKSIGLVSGVNYGQGSNNTVIKLSGGASGNVIVFANTNGVELVRNATSWSTFSDGRLKNITGTYENAIADILEIQPVKFTWKNDDSNKPCVGVIAQSVENVVPEAVSKSKNNINKEDETEYLSVRYTELIPLMIASIQELKAELDTVKAELVTLKGQ